MVRFEARSRLMPTYLEELTLRLSAAIAELPESLRARHAKYLLAVQDEDGGVGGGGGGGELVFTSFALRSLAMLGELYGPPAERAAAFLRSRLRGQESIVDFLSLIYSAALIQSAAGIDVFAEVEAGWRDAVAAALEKLRRSDGGDGKGAGRVGGSATYTAFGQRVCQPYG